MTINIKKIRISAINQEVNETFMTEQQSNQTTIEELLKKYAIDDIGSDNFKSLLNEFTSLEASIRADERINATADIYREFYELIDSRPPMLEYFLQKMRKPESK